MLAGMELQSVMLKPLLKHLMVKLNRWNKWSLFGEMPLSSLPGVQSQIKSRHVEFIQTHRSDLYGRMWAGVAISLIEDERTWNGEKIGGPIYVRQYLGLLIGLLCSCQFPRGCRSRSAYRRRKVKYQELFQSLVRILIQWTM